MHCLKFQVDLDIWKITQTCNNITLGCLLGPRFLTLAAKTPRVGRLQNLI